MGKGLRVHLRLNETDRDLCRWRHSIRCNMLTGYVSQITVADYDENMVITKEMIKSGIKAKLVVFAEDPNADHGTVCK